MSLKHTSQAMEKLDTLFKIIIAIFMVFVVLAMFDVNTTEFMAAIISVWLGLAFAIGGTIKNLVDSIVFLFVTHPVNICH